MGSLRYSVIVLCHNHLETTKRCLEALFLTDLSQARIIVVDNGSTDGTDEYLLKLIECLLGPEQSGLITPVFRSANEGVGAGYNSGFKLVDSEFVVTLNNDMIIHEPDWLEKLNEPFGDQQVAQVGLEGSHCVLDLLGIGHKIDEFSVSLGDLMLPDYVETSCMMARTDAILFCGPLFDPAFKFAYCEDADLSLRLRKAGFAIEHVPLNVEHIGGVTLQDQKTVGAKEFYVENHLFMQKRWGKYLRTKEF